MNDAYLHLMQDSSTLLREIKEREKQIYELDLLQRELAQSFISLSRRCGNTGLAIDGGGFSQLMTHLDREKVRVWREYDKLW